MAVLDVFMVFARGKSLGDVFVVVGRISLMSCNLKEKLCVCGYGRYHEIKMLIMYVLHFIITCSVHCVVGVPY